jgi:hypothetical protein
MCYVFVYAALVSRYGKNISTTYRRFDKRPKVAIALLRSFEGNRQIGTHGMHLSQEFGNEDQLVIVEDDIPEPAAREVQIAVEYSIVSGSDVNTHSKVDA